MTQDFLPHPLLSPSTWTMLQLLPLALLRPQPPLTENGSGPALIQSPLENDCTGARTFRHAIQIPKTMWTGGFRTLSSPAQHNPNRYPQHLWIAVSLWTSISSIFLPNPCFYLRKSHHRVCYLLPFLFTFFVY